MRYWTAVCVLFLLVLVDGSLQADVGPTGGEPIELDRAIPANERAILTLAQGPGGMVYGGTSGRAAHLFAFDPVKGEARSLARLEGGIGFAHGLIVLPDGSLLAGTQADPTGVAVGTDAKAVGRLLRLVPSPTSAKIEELGQAVPGQGIYALAYLPESNQVVGNTWPDGHFFTFDLKTKQMKDHGAIAGYRTFETPQHAADLNFNTKDNISYPRQVSRGIAVVPGFGALTGGKDGYLYRFDPKAQKIAKIDVRLPATPGREPWASVDAAVYFAPSIGKEDHHCVIGGTSDGHMFELRIYADKKWELTPHGRAFGQGTIQALTPFSSDALAERGAKAQTLLGVGGPFDSLPRFFSFSRGKSSALIPGGVPHVTGGDSMVGIGALLTTSDGTVYAGERDRIARLLRYPSKPTVTKTKPARTPKPLAKVMPNEEKLQKLDGWVCFAPEGTTTDGSAYTAITVGLDGKVYVGAARYGGYAWLLRFDPSTRTYFMERIVDAQQLTGERLRGIHTQGKIHAIIIVGPDGRIWFATKQAHEIFGTRPEYGEDDDGYPGGHLCYYDPKTGFSRSMGILKKQEGLMGGVMDRKRNMLYYRTEPRNYFLSYDVSTGKVKDHGHVGANCRYMAIDKDGAVYQPGRGDYLARFDPAIGYIEDLAVKLEGEGHYAAPYVIQIGPNGKLYGIGTHHPSVLEFDIDNIKKGPFPEVTVRNVAPVAPPGVPVLDIHSATFGKDGKLYFPLLTTDNPLTRRKEQYIRIMRFDPVSKRTETVGIPELHVDEAKVRHTYNRGKEYKFDHTQGMVVGADGTLFVMDIYPQLNVVVFPKLTAPR